MPAWTDWPPATAGTYNNASVKVGTWSASNSRCRYCHNREPLSVNGRQLDVICSACLRLLWRHIEQSGKLKEAEEWLLSQLTLERMP